MYGLKATELCILEWYYFMLVCMCFAFTYVCAPLVCLVMWTPEEGVTSPGVTDNCKPPVGTGNRNPVL